MYIPEKYEAVEKWSVSCRISKQGVTTISDFGPPNVNFWARKAPRKLSGCSHSLDEHWGDVGAGIDGGVGGGKMQNMQDTGPR